MFTDTELYSVLFLLGRLYCSLNKLILISLVLFQFGCFALLVKVYKQFILKVCILVLSKSCKTSVICSKHVFISYWIAVQYVVRVQHFSAFSLTRACRWRVIVIGLCVCVLPLFFAIAYFSRLLVNSYESAH